MQLVDGESKMSATAEVEAFVEASGLLQKPEGYGTVSVMGPQSSGKSTLMNLLFGTPFAVMDSAAGRSQTTLGIWVSKAEAAPLLVLDLQGTDSIEGAPPRGPHRSCRRCRA